MIKVRYAKSAIENEEGMNHLWIQLAPVGQVGKAHIQLSLPAGIHRVRNLSGFDEDQTGEIFIHNPRYVSDVFIEVFTREPVSCGEKTITVAFCYNDENGSVTRVEHFIRLMVVTDEEIDNAFIDEEVVSKIKELQQQNEGSKVQDSIEYAPTKFIRIDPNHLSEWEKKYRIEGIIQ
ncbi:hypothetical protein [Paenibacillus sp. V4I7]|uniref:hypothetical protein n=1 Tax=Paenibacillus sp. V4I7 TaxID=3042307 RepID=UPI002784512D|nr:hypothetical protein [Paenibacillus sp. V4I7]MDQ0897457.1 hypothetical protein [Paenibacillus sp. V4I7]